VVDTAALPRPEAEQIHQSVSDRHPARIGRSGSATSVLPCDLDGTPRPAETRPQGEGGLMRTSGFAR